MPVQTCAWRNVILPVGEPFAGELARLSHLEHRRSMSAQIISHVESDLLREAMLLKRIAHANAAFERMDTDAHLDEIKRSVKEWERFETISLRRGLIVTPRSVTIRIRQSLYSKLQDHAANGSRTVANEIMRRVERDFESVLREEDKSKNSVEREIDKLFNAAERIRRHL